MKRLLLSSAIATVALGFAGAASADVGACLITKTETNPFFVKMKEGAEAAAKKDGITLYSYSGKFDTDYESQLAAIETCVANGVKGILITPAQSAAVVPGVEAARKAGVLVIALDTPLDPIDAADATFATDNFQAGVLIGEWAKGTMGAKAKDAKIAFLDLDPSQPTVGVLRDQGFMTGFGIDIKDPKRWGDENDPRIVGHDTTQGSPDGGRKAMENLLAINPDINVAYAINEPAMAGGYEALKAIGREKDVITVGVDGGCPGVKSIADGTLGATSQQYPLKMASLGIDAIAQFAKDGSKPKPTEGKAFFDTGVALITDHPVDGVPSISSAEGLKLCWG